jgi:hypothetical protein
MAQWQGQWQVLSARQRTTPAPSSFHGGSRSPLSDKVSRSSQGQGPLKDLDRFARQTRSQTWRTREAQQVPLMQLQILTLADKKQASSARRPSVSQQIYCKH